MSDEDFRVLLQAFQEDYQRAARSMCIHEFSTLVGVTLANVVGNLDEVAWKEFSDCTPCGRPGCHCHEIRAKFMAALEVIRKDHQEHFGKHGPERN